MCTVLVLYFVFEPLPPANIVLGGAGEHGFIGKHPHSKETIKDMHLYTSTCLLANLRVGVRMYMGSYTCAHVVFEQLLHVNIH